MAWFSATNETMLGAVYEAFWPLSTGLLEVENLLDARRAVIRLTKRRSGVEQNRNTCGE